jgi:hypothetical protein
VSYWTPQNETVQSDYNLIFAGGKPPVIQGISEPDAWSAWRKAGQDAHSLIADPGFIAPEKDDYRLRPDSPAFKLGFQPLPVERIGPRKHDPRASHSAVGAEVPREKLVSK